MSERCFVKVQWDPASSAGSLTRAVGGFLRYIQHRDLHPDSTRTASRVGGMLKYAAYRDGATTRAELVSTEGRAGSRERKAFAAFVGRSIEESRPQLFRTRDGQLKDRRRAVYRFIISPEHAGGLDLHFLLRTSVERLAADAGVDDLRWLAAIHRNTAHHHIHLVVAGMHRDLSGVYRRLDIPRSRLAAVKEAIAIEIQRQRALERTRPSEIPPSKSAGQPALTCKPLAFATRHAERRRLLTPRVDRRWVTSTGHGRKPLEPVQLVSIRAAARWVAWRSAHDASEEARQRGWEHAA